MCLYSKILSTSLCISALTAFSAGNAFSSFCCYFKGDICCTCNVLIQIGYTTLQGPGLPDMTLFGIRAWIQPWKQADQLDQPRPCSTWHGKPFTLSKKFHDQSHAKTLVNFGMAFLSRRELKAHNEKKRRGGDGWGQLSSIWRICSTHLKSLVSTLHIVPLRYTQTSSVHSAQELYV